MPAPVSQRQLLRDDGPVDAVDRDRDAALLAEGLLRDERDLAAALANATSSERIAELCVDLVQRMPGADLVGVYLAEDATGDFVLARVVGASPEFIAAKSRFPAPSSKLAALATKPAHHVSEEGPTADDVERALHEDPVIVREGVTALSVVTFRHRGRLLGSLNVATRTLAAFPEAMRDALETVASMAGEALWRVRAESTIREHAAAHEALVRASRDGYVVIGPGGEILEASDAYCRMTGYTPEQAVTKNVADFDLDRTPTALAQLIGEIHARGWGRFEVRHRRADGTALEAEISAWVVPGSGKMGSFVRDLTAENRALAALEEHELRYQSLLRGSMDGFVVVGFDGAMLEVNDALCAMLGFSRDELLAMRTEDLDSSFITQDAGADLADIVAAGHARYEATIRRRDGSPLEVEISAWALPESRAILAFARDLTPRRRAEEELRKSEEQLRQAQKMEAVGRLAGGVAHDFNNLLTVILSYADLVAQGLEPQSPLTADLEQVRLAAERAEGLTRQLLAFSRKSVVRPVVLDVSEVVAAVEKMLRRLIGEDVELLVSVAATSPVMADRGQLEQILMNLAVNARDAMPGGGRLEISVRDVEVDAETAGARLDLRPGRFVRMRVTDTGCGMDAATLGQIFEPFFTTKGPGQGTGLGLATVYGIVRQSEGFIRVRSAPGAGATFEIDLPHVAHGPVSARAAGVDAAVARGRERVLVVEDEPGVRGLVRRVLVAAGFDVRVASSPEEAEALFAGAGGAPDLLLTDVVMPNMNGRELAERLRARAPGLHVLYMSGYAENVLGQHGVVDDGVHLLVKPFTARALTQAVRRALDLSRHEA